jgi:hypothetical protein
LPLKLLLTVDGNQLPVIPSFDTSGKTGAVFPAQNGAICVNTGVGLGVTTVVKVCDAEHCPGLGVNVYDRPLVLFITAGDQLPEIPLGETVANTGGVVPAQKGGIGVKSGVTFAFTVIGIVTGVADVHCPAAGVNV